MDGLKEPLALPAPGHTAYSTIVEGNDDLIGLVAYSLYKSDKLAYLQKHQQDVGQKPTDAEMMAFCRTSTLPGPVSAYRSKAAYLMSEMYDELLEEQVGEIDTKYKAELVAELKKAHPFWTGVWQHFWAGLTIWAFVGLTILVLYGQQIGYRQLLGNLLGLNKPSSEAPAGH
ncbi:MAG: hypothetical protein V4569_16620 [Pseudomonadota bacterium]